LVGNRIYANILENSMGGYMGICQTQPFG